MLILPFVFVSLVFIVGFFQFIDIVGYFFSQMFEIMSRIHSLYPLISLYPLEIVCQFYNILCVLTDLE